MKYVGHLAEQVPCATAHQHHIASFGRLAGRRGQAVKVLSMGWVQAKTIGHADGFLVEPLQLGIGHVFDLGGLMQQFAVEHFPAQPLGKFSGNLTAPGAILTSDGNGFHPSDSRHRKLFHAG